MFTIVLSGINLVDGGALSVYYDALDALVTNDYHKKYKIIALISDKKYFKKYLEYDNILFYEFPKSKKNWLFRIYYEYFYFRKFSKTLDVDYWISLHDITPNVVAKKKYVYCHNPSPFNNMSMKDIKYGIKYYLFSKFYKYLYQINIKKNTNVIVQQNWLKNEFEKMFNLKNVIVARPSIQLKTESYYKEELKDLNEDELFFIYPSYPRYYKNFEVVCKAVELLEKTEQREFKVYITIDGTENKYSADIVSKYKNVRQLVFCGLLERNKLFKLYSKASCLLFMSKLETWGMPIMEFATTKKPMIVSQLPYAYETVGNYDNVSFVDVNDHLKLAEEMKKVLNYKKLNKNRVDYKVKDVIPNWNELFKLILK